MKSLSLLFLVFLSLFLTVLINVGYTVDAIEIKKYKVTNSDKVCGDQLCNKADEKALQKGQSTHNVEICGQQKCKNIVDKISPLAQHRMGVPLDQISCNESFELVIKKNGKSPACVLPETALRLVEHGWAIPKQEQIKLLQNKIKTILGQDSDAKLNIHSKIINGNNYLIFEGSGWHRLHNIEITIIKEEQKVTSIRSQTNDNGVLYMPWRVPNTLQSDRYLIYGTDGINQYEITIPISQNISIKSTQNSSEIDVEIKGEKQVRRGTTHTIEVDVSKNNFPVSNAIVNITIEDYGEDIIRQFEGRTNQQGNFIFSWEIPKSFNDIETLLAYVSVTDGFASKTSLFKFYIYCLPSEKNCNIDGN